MIVYNFHKYFLNFGTEKFSKKKIKWDKNLGENDERPCETCIKQIGRNLLVIRRTSDAEF